MLSDIRIAISRQGLENRDFCSKWGTLDYQHVTKTGLCQRKQRGPFHLAITASLHCETGLVALQ